MNGANKDGRKSMCVRAHKDLFFSGLSPSPCRTGCAMKPDKSAQKRTQQEQLMRAGFLLMDYTFSTTDGTFFLLLLLLANFHRVHLFGELEKDVARG